MEQKFLIGCNYWDSVSGTDMWKKWNPEQVKKDLDALQSIGVKCLRVFPMWRDFQPVKKLYSCAGGLGEYVFGDDEEFIEEHPYGLDCVMVERFKTFAKWCEDRDMTLVVSIVTGWMSGRLFVPPAIEGKNLISDPEALMWTERFVKGIVSNFKNVKNIVMWDLGNECNNLSPAKNRYEAYTWTALVKNAILAEDNTRPISSGMHGLSAGGSNWLIQDQGRLCDYVTTHPYPSPSIGADTEPYNGLKPTIMPTAQSEYYSGVAGKPCIIQEQGAFSHMIGNAKMAADWLRINVLSALANGLKGYLWWCAMEHTHLRQAPYSWCNMERPLGILDGERQPKPLAKEMQKVSALIEKLPKEFTKKYDGVCLLTKEINKYNVGSASYILAKQAGLNLKIQNEGGYPDKASLYVMPCITGWAVLHARTLDFIRERVYNDGATLLVTFDGGHFDEIENMFGFCSNGFVVKNARHKAKFSFGEINYSVNTEVLIEPTTAKVLAENENGNPVFLVNDYGKGKVYFLNMPLESKAMIEPDALNPIKAQPLYKIYQHVAENLIDKTLVKNYNPNVGVSYCNGSDGGQYVFLINYSNEKQVVDFDKNVLKDYQIIYGDIAGIPACDGLLLRKSNN
jgi:endo-1,4-beta-mannosidase